MRLSIALRVLQPAWALAFAACASPPGSGTMVYQTHVVTSDGAEVSIVVDARRIPDERKEVYRIHGGSRRIADRVASELLATPEPDAPRPDRIAIVVTDFRLRSTSTGFWVGAMAGADRLEVDVLAERGGRGLKQFSTNTSTAVAGIIRPGSMNRFDRMVTTISRRIVAGL